MGKFVSTAQAQDKNSFSEMFKNMPYNPGPGETPMGGSRNMPYHSDSDTSVMTPMFDSEGGGYDYDSAKKAGMSRDSTGHYGSVIETTKEQRQKYDLPEESYMILKGKKHKTFHKTVAGEEKRGFEVKKLGDRYYSVPRRRR